MMSKILNKKIILDIRHFVNVQYAHLSEQERQIIFESIPRINANGHAILNIPNTDIVEKTNDGWDMYNVRQGKMPWESFI